MPKAMRLRELDAACRMHLMLLQGPVHRAEAYLATRRSERLYNAEWALTTQLETVSAPVLTSIVMMSTCSERKALRSGVVSWSAFCAATKGAASPACAGCSNLWLRDGRRAWQNRCTAAVLDASPTGNLLALAACRDLPPCDMLCSLASKVFCGLHSQPWAAADQPHGGHRRAQHGHPPAVAGVQLRASYDLPGRLGQSYATQQRGRGWPVILTPIILAGVRSCRQRQTGVRSKERLDPSALVSPSYQRMGSVEP